MRRGKDEERKRGKKEVLERQQTKYLLIIKKILFLRKFMQTKFLSL